MGRKSSAKAQTPPPSETSAPKRSFTTLLVVALAAVVLVLGGLAYWRQPDQATQDVVQAATPAVAEVPEIAKHPHPQKNLPALDFPAYPMGRPPEVVRAAYQFAAEHPEVLSYVPCFCGCEHQGHRGNEDCFVRARDVNGDVIEWEPHGMECNVCLDVAQKSMQMFASGASVADIRAAIEKEWAGRSTNHTHTPAPPPSAKSTN
jgi:hypothetical protein